MTVTMEQVLASLHPDEPRYANARTLGTEALPHLEQIIQGPDTMLASKAAYLVGLIGGPRSGPILMQAATSRNPIVRAAVAGAVAHVPAAVSTPLLARLLEDEHADVRRLAVQSLRADVVPHLHHALEKLAEAERDPTIRDVVQATLRTFRGE